MSRHFEEWLWESRAEIVACERAGALRDACIARAHEGEALISVGMYSQAEAILQDVLCETERLGLTFLSVGIQLNLGTLCAARGGSENGRAMVSKAVEEARARGSAFQEAQARIILTRILLALGQLDDAEREAQLAREMTSTSYSLNAWAHALIAQILLRTGRPVEALAAARTAKELLDSVGTAEDGDDLIRLVFAEALHANGDVDGARAALATALHSILRDAEGIRDDELRQSFLNNVPEHARILELARAWG